MTYYVYVLRSKSSGKIYIGQTDNLEKRVNQHNDGNNTVTLYTKRNRGPWKLVYYEEYNSRSEALKRERFLKKSSGRRFLRNKLGGC